MNYELTLSKFPCDYNFCNNVPDKNVKLKTNENVFDHFYFENVCSISVSNIYSLVLSSNKTPTTSSGKEFKFIS